MATTRAVSRRGRTSERGVCSQPDVVRVARAVQDQLADRTEGLLEGIACELWSPCSGPELVALRMPSLRDRVKPRIAANLRLCGCSSTTPSDLFDARHGTLNLPALAGQAP